MSSCPFCGSELKRKFRFNNMRLEEIWLTRCKGCSSEHLDPQPSNRLLAEQYRNYFKRRDSRLHLIKEEYFRYLLNKVALDLSGKRIADVGAGEGYLLSAIAQLYPNADLTGVEQGWKESAPEGIRAHKMGKTIEEWLEVEEETYDVIFGCDILEHVRKPLDVICGITEKKLKPKGKIVITTPNTDSLSALFLSTLWPQYKLEHITLFSRTSISKIAEKAGLNTLRLETLAKKLPLGYLLQVSSNFGPELVQNLSRKFEPLVPDAWLKANLTLMLGEWLWVAEKA